MQICRFHPFEQMHRHWNSDNGRQAVARLQRVVLGVVGLFVLWSACWAPDAAAQTPAATITDDGGTTVLESYADGALWAPGTFNTGTIPATGSGTRLMWHPAKAAFRAGEVGAGVSDGLEWNPTNVGDHSVAFGQNTIASGPYSIAMGNGTDASGAAATAIGDGTTATGTAATATGRETTAIATGLLTAGQCNSTSTGAFFVVGNGFYDTGFGGCSSTADALVLKDNGDLNISGTLTEASDRRLKTDIEALDDRILQKLGDLRPVRYEFKNQETHPAGEQIGLIAQDIRKEFPQLLSKGADGMLSLSYSKFTAVLLKGLQEQQTQIEHQEARIDSLEREVQRIDRIENRLARLEAQSEGAIAAALPGGRMLLAFLVGGVLGAGLLWRRRA